MLILYPSSIDRLSKHALKYFSTLTYFMQKYKDLILLPNLFIIFAQK